MRNVFPGCSHISDQQLERLWQSATIALDTNVLLNLHRYPAPKRDDLLSLLREYRTRLWIPYEVATEYERGWVSLVDALEQDFERVDASVSRAKASLRASINSLGKHPTLNPRELTALVDGVLGGVDAHLNDARSKHPSFDGQERIHREISELLVGRVGDPLPDAKRLTLIEEAKTRFERRVPPGYKDRKKDGDLAFSDFLIWAELLTRGEQCGSLIFVTDERQDDWWAKSRGRTLGPRPELVEEMQQHGALFHMYRPERFALWAALCRNRPLARQRTSGVDIELAASLEPPYRVDKHLLSTVQAAPVEVQREVAAALEALCRDPYRSHVPSGTVLPLVGTKYRNAFTVGCNGTLFAYEVDESRRLIRLALLLWVDPPWQTGKSATVGALSIGFGRPGSAAIQ